MQGMIANVLFKVCSLYLCVHALKSGNVDFSLTQRLRHNYVSIVFKILFYNVSEKFY